MMRCFGCYKENVEGYCATCRKKLFDGKNVKALEELPEGKRYKVLITLLEEIEESEEIRYVFSNSDSFTFWVNEKEDIYQEYLKK